MPILTDANNPEEKVYLIIQREANGDARRLRFNLYANKRKEKRKYESVKHRQCFLFLKPLENGELNFGIG